MSFKNQTIVFVLCFLLSFYYIRLFIYGIKRYQLNLSAYKKRKKGESFKEWLFLCRYKEEIPKKIRFFYYFILIIYPILFMVSFFAYIINLQFNIGDLLARFAFYFTGLWVLVTVLLYWSPNAPLKYERWIKKTRGKRKNKK